MNGHGLWRIRRDEVDETFQAGLSLPHVMMVQPRQQFLDVFGMLASRNRLTEDGYLLTYLNVQIAPGEYLVLAAFFQLPVQHDFAYFEIRVGHILSFGQQCFVRDFQLHLGFFLFRKLPLARLDHNEILNEKRTPRPTQ